MAKLEMLKIKFGGRNIRLTDDEISLALLALDREMKRTTDYGYGVSLGGVYAAIKRQSR